MLYNWELLFSYNSGTLEKETIVKAAGVRKEDDDFVFHDEAGETVYILPVWAMQSIIRLDDLPTEDEPARIMHITPHQVSVILKALESTEQIFPEGPFLDQVKEITVFLRKSRLVKWEPRQFTPQVGDWVSICCERDLHCIETQEKAASISQIEALGLEVMLFSSRESATRWFDGRDDLDTPEYGD